MKTIKHPVLTLFTLITLTLISACGSMQVMTNAQQASVYQFTIIMQGNQYTPQQKEWMTRQACYDLGVQWSLGQTSYPAFNNPEFNNLRKIEVAATQGLVNLNRVNCLHNAFQRYRMNEDQRFNNTTLATNNMLIPQVPEQDIRKLMSLGADLNYPGNLGKRRTPLFYAAGSVVEHGADQNFKYYRSQSTYLYVILVQLGARDDIVDADGFTPKHIFMEVYYPKQLQQAYMYNAPTTQYVPITAPTQSAGQTTGQNTNQYSAQNNTQPQINSINQQVLDQQYALAMKQSGKNKNTVTKTTRTPVTQRHTPAELQTQHQNQQLAKHPSSNTNQMTSDQQQENGEAKGKQKKDKMKKQKDKNKTNKADKSNKKKKGKKGMDVIPNEVIANTAAGTSAVAANTTQTTTNINSAPVIQTPVAVPAATQEESSSNGACYQIDTGAFYQSSAPKEAPVGSSAANYSVAAYKMVYCVEEQNDSNHRDRNKNVVTKYLQVRKLDASNPMCKRGNKQGVFNSLEKALSANAQTFSQLKKHHCDSENRW